MNTEPRFFYNITLPDGQKVQTYSHREDEHVTRDPEISFGDKNIRIVQAENPNKCDILPISVYGFALRIPKKIQRITSFKSFNADDLESSIASFLKDFFIEVVYPVSQKKEKTFNLFWPYISQAFLGYFNGHSADGAREPSMIQALMGSDYQTLVGQLEELIGIRLVFSAPPEIKFNHLKVQAETQKLIIEYLGLNIDYLNKNYND